MAKSHSVDKRPRPRVVPDWKRQQQLEWRVQCLLDRYKRQKNSDILARKAGYDSRGERRRKFETIFTLMNGLELNRLLPQVSSILGKFYQQLQEMYALPPLSEDAVGVAAGR